MKPGNCIPGNRGKIIYDEVIPIEGDGLDGDTPLDIDKDCRLQIRKRNTEEWTKAQRSAKGSQIKPRSWS